MSDELTVSDQIAEGFTHELKRYNEERSRERAETPEALANRRAMREPMRKIRPTVLMVPALAVPFRNGGVEIPGEYWSQSDIGAAIVACPCRLEPEVELGVPRICDCGRGYLYTGKTVLVAFSPKATLPVEVPADAD